MLMEERSATKSEWTMVGGEVEFFVEQLTEEREQWKVDHDEAMECRDVEELLRTGLGLFAIIRLSDEVWSKKVQAGTAQFDPARAIKINKAYQWWLVPCDYVLARLAKAELSFAVEQADHFRACYRLAKHLANIDTGGLAESVKQMQLGQVEPLNAEVFGGVSGSDNA